MVDKLVNYIVDRQIASGKIKQEEGSVYRYGYTLFFEKLINILIVTIICIITGKWIEIWEFLLAVIPLRSFAGGWHADKFWQCAILSNFMVVLMLFWINMISVKTIEVYIIIEAVVLIIILSIMPTQNSNKPLSLEEMKKYKKITAFTWIIECCVMLVFMIYKEYIYSFILLYTHIIVAVAAIGGTMGKRNKIQRAGAKEIK